jgi:hypothetical protein
MSRKGNCWDDAVVESFFSRGKEGADQRHIYRNRKLAIADVADCIDAFYIARGVTVTSAASV